MMDLVEAFSPSYALARVKFLEAAAAAGLAISSYEHPLKGRDGEALALDVAIAGPAEAANLLVVSSGCHGVEGYCGSGVQVFALHDKEWAETAARQGVAVMYIHALNPYGFSHLRRVTHENVDLNRNFNDYALPLPVNEAYREVHAFLLPDLWPPDAQNATAIGAYVQHNGIKRFQAAVTQGQHEFADGLFFGGTAPTWSNQTVRKLLRRHAASARRLGWIDLHTGLGPSGVGERIFACKDDAAALGRTRQWWGGGGSTPVTSFYDGSSASARLTGLLMNAAYEECPQAEYTSIAMEYGTLPIEQTISALRAEQWLHLHPQASPELARQIKQQMLDAFYTDTDAWKGQIISQARQCLFQAAAGLRGAGGA